MKNIKIIVSTHKEYNMPSDDIYLPVFAGSALTDLNLPYQRDDEGENISVKNKYYSELTALYWAYKNLKADYIGLCHYHRYLDLKGVKIEGHDVILPKKRHYYIETVYSQYTHAHGSAGLDIAREIISDYYHKYLDSFDECMKRKSLHIYNIFIMKYDIFIQYCDFLFNILFKIEDRLGEVDRLYGYISERLLDVFLIKNNIDYIETGIIETEHINWSKKICKFLKRKYINGKV